MHVLQKRGGCERKGPGRLHGVFDPQTGLIYLRARYYSPVDATFISQDSHLGDISRIDSANRYAYAENDPVNNTDPSGHAIGTSSYERQMEAAGGINEIYNFYVGKTLQNSLNQATASFNGTLGRAQATDYTSIGAINSIAYVTQGQANGYINAGAAAALSVGSWYGCTPGALTLGAVASFARDVNTAKDTTNTRIANVQAGKYAQYAQLLLDECCPEVERVVPVMDNCQWKSFSSAISCR
jgi:RHS repeat-associated protein